MRLRWRTAVRAVRGAMTERRTLMGFMDRVRAALATPPAAAPAAWTPTGVYTLQGKVAGTSHRQHELWQIAGGDPDSGMVEEMHQALIVPEPDNPHDPNALMVTIDGLHVGYIPKDDQADVAPRVVAAGGELAAPAEFIGGIGERNIGVRLWFQ